MREKSAGRCPPAGSPARGMRTRQPRNPGVQGQHHPPACVPARVAACARVGGVGCVRVAARFWREFKRVAGTLLQKTTPRKPRNPAHALATISEYSVDILVVLGGGRAVLFFAKFCELVAIPLSVAGAAKTHARRRVREVGAPPAPAPPPVRWRSSPPPASMHTLRRLIPPPGLRHSPAYGCPPGLMPSQPACPPPCPRRCSPR